MNITARRPLFVSIVACGVFLSFGADQTLSGADLSPEDVETLIRQLGGERVAERRAAEQKLLDAGPAVLPLLPDVANVVDPAARDALRRLLPELESQAAAAEIRPSRVTCSGVMTVAEVLGELERQTGNHVRIDAFTAAETRTTLSVDWNETSFWWAVTDVCRLLKLEPAPGSDGEPSLTLVPKTDQAVGGANPAVHLAPDRHGAFLVSMPELLLRENPGQDQASLLQLRLMVWGEPRLRPLFLRVSDADVHFHDATGEYSPLSPRSARDIEFSDSGVALLDISYLAGRQPDLTGARVDGRFAVELVSRIRQLRFRGFERSLPNVSRSGQVVASLDAVRRLGRESAEFQLTLRYADGGPAFESHRIGALYREVYLELPGGVRRLPTSAEFTREQSGTIGSRYRFSELPESWEGVTFVCRVPTAIATTPVDFELLTRTVEADESLPR